MSYHDPYRPTSAIPSDYSPPKAAQPEDESEKVPSGTTKEILDWVGDDKERAQKALDAENAHDKPRKGVVEELSALVEDDEEE